MAAELVFKAFFSIVDLLRGSFFLAIISFVFVFVASFFHAWITKKLNLSWLKATLITSYLAIFILIMVLYFLPVFSAFQQSDQGIIPSFFVMTPMDWLSFAAGIILRNAAVSLFLVFLLLPLEFFASFVFDSLKEKTKLSHWIKVFLSVFAACLVAAIILLFLLDWVVTGLVYLVFLWHL